MGTKTKIEWTEATWNPVRGCSIVSEGCRNCYAMRMAHRSNRPGGAYEGLTRIGAHGPTWTGDVRFVPELLDYPLRLRKPHRIFVNSMSDLFHEKVTDEQIDQIFAVMALADWHTFQLLTKRPKRMLDYLNDSNCAYRVWNAAFDFAARYPRLEELAQRHQAKRDGDNARWPLLNLWPAVSIEDQPTADERIPLLLRTPAAVRWISAEPLQSKISLERWLCSCPVRCEFDGSSIPCSSDGYLDWVVAGGESGPGARPMHPDWARSIRDQCQSAGVPFFFKQWGKYLPLGPVVNGDEVINGTAVFDQDGERLLPDCCGNDYDVEDDQVAIRFGPVGKKAAGNLLDGRQHLEYPA